MMPITVIGSLNLDLVTSVPHLPQPGETVLGTGLVRRTGGKGANQAIATSRAGGTVRMAGTRGPDEAGELLIRALDEEGVDTTLVRAVEGEATGTAMIMVDASGENVIALTSGANALMTQQQVDEACAELTGDDVLLLQLELPLSIVGRAAGTAKDRSATVILNAAPAIAGAADLLPLIDILVVNEPELDQVSRECGISAGDVESQTRQLAREGDCLVVTTLGAKGALMADPTTCAHFPAPAVEVVDSTGAGDTFTGFLAAGLSRGLETVGAIRLAVGAASVMVTRHGTQGAIPRLDEIGSTVVDEQTPTSPVSSPRQGR